MCVRFDLSRTLTALAIKRTSAKKEAICALFFPPDFYALFPSIKYALVVREKREIVIFI
jgi:hypothetical protein